MSCFPLLFYSMASSLARGRKKPPLPQEEDKRERERGERRSKEREREREQEEGEKCVALEGWKGEASIMKVFS